MTLVVAEPRREIALGGRGEDGFSAGVVVVADKLGLDRDRVVEQLRAAGGGVAVGVSVGVPVGVSVGAPVGVSVGASVGV